jgi:hypothetical protein
MVRSRTRAAPTPVPLDAAATTPAPAPTLAAAATTMAAAPVPLVPAVTTVTAVPISAAPNRTPGATSGAALPAARTPLPPSPTPPPSRASGTGDHDQDVLDVPASAVLELGGPAGPSTVTYIPVPLQTPSQTPLLALVQQPELQEPDHYEPFGIAAAAAVIAWTHPTAGPGTVPVVRRSNGISYGHVHGHGATGSEGAQDRDRQTKITVQYAPRGRTLRSANWQASCGHGNAGAVKHYS